MILQKLTLVLVLILNRQHDTIQHSRHANIMDFFAVFHLPSKSAAMPVIFIVTEIIDRFSGARVMYKKY